ncbi:hypothetical protein [Rhizobium paknamense]|uniref:Uncharacterized protein n=1 Tax=Rhizobium paknamense TaxID=1206817 RepID=A0ABU0I8Y2_9HYPH|nr:hypothetical protein [Rhizobium paknamense]MDQ0454694.1 hypothetical protein [Rhizobium paknamense]
MRKPPANPMPETGFTIAVVTDHAVLRFLERRHGIDVEAIRAEIRDLCTTGVRFGAAKVIADGMKFVIQDQDVVTCFRVQQGKRI